MEVQWMEETISLKEIFEVIQKRFFLILGSILGVTAIVACITFFVLTPIYEAKTQFIVNHHSQDQGTAYNINDIRFNVELINTYNDILKSPSILESVMDRLGISQSPESFGKKIDLTSSQNSQVVTVKVTDPDPVFAVNIANTTVEVFQEQLPQIMNMNVDNVHVISEAKLAPEPSPVSPRPKLNLAIAVVLGGMIGLGLAFLFEYFDTTIKTEEEIEQHLELPVLGIISKIEQRDVRAGYETYQKLAAERREYNVQTKT